MVGSRARVTASNNVFSPLCVLAVRGRAEGEVRRGRERSMPSPPPPPLSHVGPRLLIHPPQSISSIPLVADGAWGWMADADEKRVAVSPAAASRPLHLSCSLHSTKGAVDGFLRSSDGATPKSPRPFVSASRWSFD